MPLVEIASNANTTIDIYDSLLSEEAVLGFEWILCNSTIWSRIMGGSVWGFCERSPSGH